MVGKQLFICLVILLCCFNCDLVFSQTEESDQVTFINTTVQWCDGSEWFKSCEEITLSQSVTLVVNESYVEEGFLHVKISHQDVPVLYRNSLAELRINTLDITFCELGSIEDGAFQNSQVNSLTLSHNNLTNIGKNTFRNANVTWDLSLDNNAIGVIEEGVFSGMDLEILDLSNNQIEELALGVFYNASICYLNISCNKLKSIRNEVFRNIGKLRTLDLSNNSINSVESGLLKNLPKLRFLYLNKNLLQNIPNDMFSFKKFTRLNLSENNISSIPLKAFQNSTFRYLNLAGNKLDVIQNGIFDNNSIVYYLDLSKNRVLEIEPNALDAVYGGIDLQFNDMLAIKKSTFNNAIIVDLLNNKKLRKIEDGSFNGRTSRRNFYIITASSRPTLYIDKECLDEESERYLNSLEMSGNYTLMSVKHSIVSFSFR